MRAVEESRIGSGPGGWGDEDAQLGREDAARREHVVRGGGVRALQHMRAAIGDRGARGGGGDRDVRGGGERELAAAVAESRRLAAEAEQKRLEREITAATERSWQLAEKEAQQRLEREVKRVEQDSILEYEAREREKREAAAVVQRREAEAARAIRAMQQEEYQQSLREDQEREEVERKAAQVCGLALLSLPTPLGQSSPPSRMPPSQIITGSLPHPGGACVGIHTRVIVRHLSHIVPSLAAGDRARTDGGDTPSHWPRAVT